MRNKYGPTQRFRIGVCVACMLAATVAGSVDGAEPDTQFDVKRAPWPCFRGPYGNGSAPVQGLELVEDLDDAGLAWKSEVKLPPGTPWPGPWRTHPTAWKGGKTKKVPWQQQVWSGGYGSPIVAERKVFLACWRMPGRTDWSLAEKDGSQKHASRRKDVKADDLLYCFDAATGKLLWFAEQKEQGRPFPGYFNDAWMVIAWWDGCVFVPGTGEHLYAIDTAEGRLLWTGEIPRAGAGTGKLQTAGAAVSGGVVVCGEDRLTAWDCATGEDLWSGVAKRPYCIPVAWQHGGESFFVVGGKLIEARTGKVRWEIPDPSESTTGDSVSGDYLVMSHRDAKSATRAKHGITCFRISPDRFEELWHEEWGYKPNCNRITAVAVLGGLVVGKITDGARTGVGCLDLATGARCGKRERFPMSYAPLAAEGRVVTQHEESLNYAAVDAAGLRPLTAKKAGWIISQCTHPAYANGFVYFRQTQADGHARMVCYDLRAATKRSEDGRAAVEGTETVVKTERPPKKKASRPRQVKTFCSLPAAVLAADVPAEVRQAVTRLRDKDHATRIAASREIAVLSDQAVPAVAELVSLLGDRYFEVRENLCKAIVAAGGAATPHLREALGSDVYHVRTGALACLREIGAPARGAAPEVVAVARAGKGSIVGLALGTLASIDTDALVSVCGPLLEASGDVTESEETVSLLRLVAAAGPKAKPAVESHARKLLASRERGHVLQGVELLEKVDAHVDRNEAIADLLEREKGANWKWFCSEVKDQGKAGAWAVPHLVMLINTGEDPWMAPTACTVLESIGPPEASAAVPHLIKALDRPQPTTRRYAARTLVALEADPGAVLPALRKTLESVEDERARAWLAEAIEKISAVANGRAPGAWVAD